MKKMQIILCFILSICLLVGCESEEGEAFNSEENTLEYDGESNAEFNGEFNGSSMSISEDGSLKIVRNRNQKAGGSLLEQSADWTILVYLCGTDLETDDGSSTLDLEEMLEASTGDSVRFVIQTGGTEEWQNDEIDSSKTQRFVICDGTMELVDEKEAQNFGAPETLSDFLKWGLINYPARKTGVVFWNHGSGSINGVCFDECYDYDSLSLREIDQALLDASSEMEENFAFIGFDACLMATMETANILASYADYMYASEEFEPGNGWDYTAIGNFLGENPQADAKALGVCVSDSYYESCCDTGDESMATFSIIDLSAIDGLLTTFHEYIKDLYEKTEDEDVLSSVVRQVWTVDNFGGNNRSEGYTNMVDLAGILQAGGDYTNKEDAVIKALKQAVVYTANGSDHEDACGLSTYYPLEIQGSSELKNFGDIAVSPYYLSFVDRAAYCSANGEGMEDYDNSIIMSLWDFLWGDDAEEEIDDAEETEGSEETDNLEDYWSCYDNYELTGESPYITFEEKPHMGESGTYEFQLSEEGLNYAASVQASVLKVSDDGEDLIDLGMTTDIVGDWETGIFSDNFDGYWFSLPDGQNLAIYLVSEEDGYDVFTSPVEVNGKRTNLRISYNYVDGEVHLDGVWDGIAESGMCDREIVALESGDSIVPIYEAEAIDGDEKFDYRGDEYTFDGDPELYFDILPDGDYVYGFSIDDIFGDYYACDYVLFYLENGEVYY